MVWAPEHHFNRHVPLMLLTGFLGSGKTTLLNWLLGHPDLRDTAIAINEFGAVPLDHAFIQAPSDDVVVLSNGCLCCFASDDIEQSLVQLFQRSRAGDLPPFRRLVLETSGLADPEFVLQSILATPFASSFLWLDSILTTVDAKYGSDQLARHGEARKQAQLADRIIITKADMVDDAVARELTGQLRAINGDAPILLKNEPTLELADIMSAFFLDRDPDVSLLGQWVRRDHALSCDGAHVHGGCGHDHDRTHAFSTVLRADVAVDWRRFQLWLGEMQRALGSRLLRVKGLVRVAGQDCPVVVHAVQGTQHVPVSLDQWPDVDRSTRIVFIVADGDDGMLTACWQHFLTEHAVPDTMDAPGG
jgi:G3E family GTPase